MKELLTSARCANLIARPVQNEMMRVISAARSRILVCSYMTLEGQLLSALAHAAARGVDVWVVLDRESGGLPATRQQLPGTVCFFTNPENVDHEAAIMHIKCLVVDRNVVLLGSWNLTPSGMKENLELGITAVDHELAMDIEEFVESLLSRAMLVAV